MVKGRPHWRRIGRGRAASGLAAPAPGYGADMAESRDQDLNSYGKEAVLPHYGMIVGVYAAAVAAYGGAFLASGRRLPRRIPALDVVVLGTATFKLSRLVSRDKVLSFLRAPFTHYEGDASGPEVNERPRGSGIRHQVGELVTCPFCTGQWAGSALMGLYLAQPALGRTVASLLSAIALADGLQFAETALQS